MERLDIFQALYKLSSARGVRFYRTCWHPVFLDCLWLDLSLWSNFHLLIHPSPAFRCIHRLNQLDLLRFEPDTRRRYRSLPCFALTGLSQTDPGWKTPRSRTISSSTIFHPLSPALHMLNKLLRQCHRQSQRCLHPHWVLAGCFVGVMIMDCLFAIPT